MKVKINNSFWFIGQNNHIYFGPSYDVTKNCDFVVKVIDKGEFKLIKLSDVNFEMHSEVWIKFKKSNYDLLEEKDFNKTNDTSNFHHNFYPNLQFSDLLNSTFTLS